MSAAERPSPLLLGVRHHGPGSARAVRRALEAFRPEIVLIEGPPEADALVGLVGAASMRPPVALLAYSPPGSQKAASQKSPSQKSPSQKSPSPKSPSQKSPSRAAAFWPFAEFSPEWQALVWAVAHSVPVRFMDLPVAVRFGRSPAPEISPDEDSDAAPGDTDAPGERERFDPIGQLAEAAGYDDPERWWEDVVEHRLPSAVDELDAAVAPFAAIGAAMAEVRASAPDLPESEAVEERQREAHMRTVLRAALKQHSRVAVVCGAWHVPALTAPLPTASADATVLRGLPKSKVAMTWVPWTHGRLASWQGYGAGVTSPGWYHHLFTVTDRPITRWLVAVAGLLRAEGQPVSSAHVIEAVRLAEALAVLRGRPLAGLAEVSEATRAVLCDGDDLRMHLVDRRLVVGEQLGGVPEETPSVPLVVDVAAAQRRLRMQLSALVSDLDLDLRRDIDIERSRLLHRLRLLGVEWGEPVEGGRRGKGTFWESWRLRWHPEFAVDLIEASGYGNTVPLAASTKVGERAAAAQSLADVTELVWQCLLADLPDAWPGVLRALEDRAALDADVAHLMDAVPALARTLRYGDVRGTDVSALRAVLHGLVVRICVGLPQALTALDDSAATAMRGHLEAVDGALGLISDAALTDEWQQTLARVYRRDDLHGLVAGRLTRLLLDSGRLDADSVGRDMGLVLTVGVPPPRAAAWVEGFLAGGGLLLVHDERLLALVDAWLTGIPADTFLEVLPLLRRTFAEFAEPERRAIGERVRHLAEGQPRRTDGPDLDHRRAAAVLPTLRALLGPAAPLPAYAGAEASVDTEAAVDTKASVDSQAVPA